MTASSDVQHPSYLALDRACLSSTNAAVEAHLTSCEQCRDYVASLSQAPPLPNLLLLQARIARAKRRRGVLWSLSVPAAAAAGALLFLGLRPQSALPEHPSYVGAKGFSSVWIYVKHGPSSGLWDGKHPVSVGDRLRLKVDPGQFRRIEVFSVKDPNAPEPLYAGEVVPGQSLTLPDAWEVDAEPGDERLVVVLSSGPIKPDWPDWLEGKAPPDVWVRPFVLPKSGSAAVSPGSTSP
jgi:hypothetical protein